MGRRRRSGQEVELVKLGLERKAGVRVVVHIKVDGAAQMWVVNETTSKESMCVASNRWEEWMVMMGC